MYDVVEWADERLNDIRILKEKLDEMEKKFVRLHRWGVTIKRMGEEEREEEE